MKQLYLFLTLFLFISCSQEVDNLQIENSTSFEKEGLPTKFSKESIIYKNEETTVDRLRINSDFSLIVKRIYNLNSLEKITYLLDYQQPNDKVQILDLRDNNNPQAGYYLFALDSNVNNINAISLFESSLASDGGGVEYDCECSSIEADKVDDCVVRRFRNLVYCDGNFCTACSVVVQIEEAERQNIQTNTSVILLPSNFKI